MGAPHKTTVPYFSHYTTLEKIDGIILIKFNAEGYGFIYLLKALLGRTPGHTIHCNSKIDWEYFLSETMVNEKTANEIIDLLCELGEIDKELWEDEKRIWWQNFVDLLDPVYDKRKGPKPTKHGFGHENRGFRSSNGVPDIDNGVSDIDNSQSKVKDSKVNKNKGEESRGSLSDKDLNELQVKYPKVTVKESYDQFVNHNKSIGKKFVDLKAAFENWLKRDIDWGKNPRKKSRTEVDLYCINRKCEKFGNSKKVRNDMKVTNTFCDDCKHQMVQRYEYEHELNRSSNVVKTK